MGGALNDASASHAYGTVTVTARELLGGSSVQCTRRISNPTHRERT